MHLVRTCDSPAYLSTLVTVTSNLASHRDLCSAGSQPTRSPEPRWNLVNKPSRLQNCSHGTLSLPITRQQPIQRNRVYSRSCFHVNILLIYISHCTGSLSDLGVSCAIEVFICLLKRSCRNIMINFIVYAGQVLWNYSIRCFQFELCSMQRAHQYQHSHQN